jgi:hypothetical protein
VLHPAVSSQIDGAAFICELLTALLPLLLLLLLCTQVFQLMHPSDHVGVTWNTIDLTTSPFPGDAPGNATKWVWTEIPASGCKINNTHMECPASQPGYTCKSITAAQLKRIATLNLSMVTSELTSAVEDGLELSVVTMRYEQGMASCIPYSCRRRCTDDVLEDRSGIACVCRALR